MTEPCPICHQYHDTTACPPVTTYIKDDYPTVDPVRAWKEGYRAGVEAMRDAALKESWQMGVTEKELDEYEGRLKNRATCLIEGKS